MSGQGRGSPGVSYLGRRRERKPPGGQGVEMTARVTGCLSRSHGEGAKPAARDSGGQLSAGVYDVSARSQREVF